MDNVRAATPGETCRFILRAILNYQRRMSFGTDPIPVSKVYEDALEEAIRCVEKVHGLGDEET